MGRRAAASPPDRYSDNAQKCGGVQKKMIANSASPPQPISPVTAAQPISGGKAPAAPPITMFCGVRPFSQTVKRKTQNPNAKANRAPAAQWTDRPMQPPNPTPS